MSRKPGIRASIHNLARSEVGTKTRDLACPWNRRPRTATRESAQPFRRLSGEEASSSTRER